MNILIGIYILVFLHILSNILLSSPSKRRYMIDASSKKSIEESFEAIGGEVGIEEDARVSCESDREAEGEQVRGK